MNSGKAGHSGYFEFAATEMIQIGGRGREAVVDGESLRLGRGGIFAICRRGGVSGKALSGGWGVRAK